jgi:4-oxalocrotonate tautomerase
MPFVNIKIVADVFSGDEIEKATEAMVSVKGGNLREVTVVVLEEVKSGHWGLGGRTLTAEHVKRLRAG